MMEGMRNRSLILVVPVFAMAVALLVGCVPEKQVEPGGVTATPSPTSTPTPSPTASAAPTDAVDGTPMTITCDQLVSAQAMYDYNSNFTPKPGYSPAAGSLAAEVARQHGLTCGWVNQTSGEVIEIAVANLPEAHLTDLKNTLVTTSHSVPTYDVEGYFILNGSTGEAQAFSDPYWIVATSTAFFEPGDAEPLVKAAIAALG